MGGGLALGVGSPHSEVGGRWQTCLKLLPTERLFPIFKRTNSKHFKRAACVETNKQTTAKGDPL